MKNYALALLVVAGCSSEGAQVNITKSIGSAGGTVSGTDGTSVAIPMGALTTSSNITIASVTVNAPTGTVIVGPAYDFGPEGTTFSQSVTITLPFDSAKIPSGRTSADIRVYTAPRGSTNYTQLATTVSGNTVVATTNHFTVFVPAVPSEVTDGCKPNCTASGTSCGCTATCGSASYALNCVSEVTDGPAYCTCSINGDPLTDRSIVLDGCTSTQAQSAFMGQCLPN